jgi:hypothetical protein
MTRTAKLLFPVTFAVFMAVLLIFLAFLPSAYADTLHQAGQEAVITLTGQTADGKYNWCRRSLTPVL